MNKQSGIVEDEACPCPQMYSIVNFAHDAQMTLSFLWKCQKIQTTKGVWFYFQRNIFWYIFSPLWGEKVWATFSHRKSHCGKLLNVIVLQITEDLTVEMWLKWLLKNKIKQNKTTTKKAITTMEKNKNKKCMKQSLKKIQKDCTSHCRMACNINVLKMSVFKPH